MVLSTTFKEDIGSWPSGLEASGIKSGLLTTLMRYRANEVALSGIADELLEFLICIKPVSGVPVLFRAGRSVRLITDYALIGWDEGIYRHDVQRFYQPDAKALPNMLLGIHVLLLAIATNNNCGSPIKVVVATNSGMSEVPAKHVTDLESRVSLFNKLLDQITLQLSDTSIPTDDFRKTVTEFRNSALLLHDNYVNSHAWDSFARVFFDKDFTPDAVQEMPPGSVASRTKEGEQTVVEWGHKWTCQADLIDDDLDQD